MEKIQKIKAGELALALSWGYADLSEAVEWADEQISSIDTPDPQLFELSLATNTSDAASYLRSIAEGVDPWTSASCFLSRFHSLKTMPPKEASQLAKKLYFLAQEEDAPIFFNNLSSHWDAIDCAIDGVSGNPKDCVQNFLKDIREIVDKTPLKTD